MGGKSGGDPKMRVTRYYLSGHWGICQGPVDAIKAIWVGEKKAWTGNVTENGSIGVAKDGLFGGMKKEGGVSGRIAVMLGGEDQTPPPSLISRLRQSSGNVPGFRGITSLFFYGAGENAPEDAPWGGLFGFADFFILMYFKGRSFYWGTQPYLKPLWVTVQRIPARDLAPATAPIPRFSRSTPTSVYMVLDDSGSMSWDSEGNTNPEPGTSRIENLRAALRIVIDQLRVQVSQGQRLDLGMAGINKGRIERTNVTLGDLDDFRAFVDAFNTDLSQGTDFSAPMPYVVDWFEATRNDTSLASRINFFVTDGVPMPSGTDDTAKQLVQHLLDREIPVDMWGINIDLQDTSATTKLHNMDVAVPVVSGDNPDEIAAILQTGVKQADDANPAHVIHECLTDTDWGMGADPASIDTASFQAASATLYKEGFGLFLQWTAQSSIEDFINDVLEHIKGALYPNPRTGQMTLRLLRDDLDIDTLKEITPDNASMANFSRKGWGETTNEVVVTWTNPDTEKEETVRMQDLANVAQQGGVVSSSKNYHGIRTPGLAVRVAERDLREESAPLSSCEVEVNREFWDVTPFDGVKMTWPEYGLDGLVMRVMKVNYGDSSNSTIKLSLMEDVFSLSPASFVTPAEGEWQDPGAAPVPVETARLMPIPAYVASQAGINLDTLEHPTTGIAPMPTNPTSDESARYDVLEEVATASGGTEFQEATGDRPFPGTATMADDLPPAVESIGVVLEGLFGVAPAVDELVMLGDSDLDDDALELALVTAVDSETGALTLLRGALDTVPRRWPAGTLVTITNRSIWRPLPREYTDTQSLTLRFLTSTSFGMLEDYEAPDYVGTAYARPTKPTRAANVKVNSVGLDTPDAALPFGDTVVTWSHRNRLLEDQALYAWDLTSITPETGTTYTASVYGEDDTLLDSEAGLTGETWTYTEADELALGLEELPYTGIFDYTGTLPSPGVRVNSNLRITLETERDGEAAWQAFDHTLSRAGYGYGYGQFYGGT